MTLQHLMCAAAVCSIMLAVTVQHAEAHRLAGSGLYHSALRAFSHSTPGVGVLAIMSGGDADARGVMLASPT